VTSDEKTDKSSRTFWHNSEFDDQIRTIEKRGGLSKTPDADAMFLGLAYAIGKGMRSQPIPKGKKSGSIREWAIKQNREQLMKVIALLHTQDTKVLQDWDQIYEICQDYANAGFGALVEKENLDNFPNPLEQIVNIALIMYKSSSEQ
jgi:hypothetical protein